MLRLLFLATMASTLACASLDNVIVAEPGVTFALPLGKTAAVAGPATTDPAPRKYVAELVIRKL